MVSKTLNPNEYMRSREITLTAIMAYTLHNGRFTVCLCRYCRLFNLDVVFADIFLIINLSFT